MQPITIAGAAFCLFVLYWRYQTAKRDPNPKPRTFKQKYETAKILGAALLVWLMISLNLRRLNHSLSSDTPLETSLFDRIVEYLSK
jgi:hypothetical protein